MRPAMVPTAYQSEVSAVRSSSEPELRSSLTEAGDTTIKDIFFYDSTVKNSQNGVRIKTVSGATNSVVQNVVFQNIKLSNISTYGIVSGSKATRMWNNRAD